MGAFMNMCFMRLKDNTALNMIIESLWQFSKLLENLQNIVRL